MPMNSGPSSVQNPAFLKWLIVMGLIEGTSTLVLFGIAMPLKYMYDMPMAVTITGMVHGLFFLVLVGMCLMAKSIVPLSTRLVVWGIIGAILPFGPFVVDVALYRLLRSN